MMWVRVKHKVTGHEYTVSERAALLRSDVDVLEKPATYTDGSPIPPKLRVKLPPPAAEPEPETTPEPEPDPDSWDTDHDHDNIQEQK